MIDIFIKEGLCYLNTQLFRIVHKSIATYFTIILYLLEWYLEIFSVIVRSIIKMLEIGKNPVEIRIFIRLILNECGYKVKRLCCCKCLYEAIKIDTRNEARQAKN